MTEINRQMPWQRVARHVKAWEKSLLPNNHYEDAWTDAKLDRHPGHFLDLDGLSKGL